MTVVYLYENSNNIQLEFSPDGKELISVELLK